MAFIIEFAFLLLGIVAVCYFIQILFQRNTNSLHYRKYLANLYVAAKIRFLASEDGLDLVKEEKAFTEYDSLSNKRRIENLDEKIEQDLMDKVNKPY